MPKEWFILNTKLNAHHKAVKNLNHQGFETFLPLYEVASQRARQFTNTTRPLFPGYMFVRFDREKCKWHKINNTYGVSRLITFNSCLKPIPTIIVNNLIKRCDLSGKLLPVEKLKKGDKVTVLNGPFANFVATVEMYKNDKRIWILMNLMGRETKIQSPAIRLQLLN
jgi:transcriptional antiterminator RfaH